MFSTVLVAAIGLVQAKESDGAFSCHDPSPRRYQLAARASELDSRAKPHPEIDFVFEKEGKPADVQHAAGAVGMRARNSSNPVLASFAARLNWS